jgi:hypothetical protein
MQNGIKKKQQRKDNINEQTTKIVTQNTKSKANSFNIS